MKNFLFTFCALLTTTATAQQNVKATFAPVTIDGKVSQKGLVTINGKTYVSLDALSAAKVTLLKPNSLGIYNFSAKANTPVKLSGCMNEWLTDGTTRARVTDFSIGTIGNTYWIIRFELMTSKDSDSTQNIFAPGQQEVTMTNGEVIAPAKDSFAKIDMPNNTFKRSEAQRNIVTFIIPNISEANPPAKLLMTPAASAQVKAPWVFDLTCKK